MDQKPNPDPELASELRQSAGAEWAEEAAEDERLTELMRRRKLGLTDVAKEMANRGERVTADFGGHTFSGAVIGAGDDFVAISGSGQVAEVRLATARWAILTAEGPPVEKAPVEESFKATMHQHSETGTLVRLALDGEDMVIGKITVVAGDHLEIVDADGRGLYVPMDMVLGIIRSTDFQ